MRETFSSTPVTRREAVRRALFAAAALAVPAPLTACGERRDGVESAAREGTAAPDSATTAADPADERRLIEWVDGVRESGAADRSRPLGETVVAVGELAAGARTPYVAYTLEEYITAGGAPARAEPLTLSLQHFDCVTLVESCLAIARVARRERAPTWASYAREMERMRYRGGERQGYLSRLHYFSEWLQDNEERGLVELKGEALGGEPDRRPLRFMTRNRDEYPALADPEIYRELRTIERGLDGRTRWVVPTARIPDVADRIETGDVLAFATAIEGLDVTHSALAYRDDADRLRVLHAPLSGGVVEITEATLPEYVAAISRSTGILVARPLEPDPERA